jgi:hypothetical protein
MADGPDLEWVVLTGSVTASCCLLPFLVVGPLKMSQRQNDSSAMKQGSMMSEK